RAWSVSDGSLALAHTSIPSRGGRAGSSARSPNTPPGPIDDSATTFCHQRKRFPLCAGSGSPGATTRERVMTGLRSYDDAVAPQPGEAPPVRDFALTYPQLARQAITAGLDDQALRDMRDVFEVAQRHYDGLYRASGQPFLCHMVRTASILLAEGKPLPLVQ